MPKENNPQKRSDMEECGDCYWFYHVPEKFAEIKINGEYMCTNREVKTVSVDKDLLACSKFRKIKEKAL